MSSDLSPSRSAQHRPAALFALAVTGVLAAATTLYDPRYTQLVLYGLYAIPAHLLISFLPNEPALFYAAKLYSPAEVALAGTAACVAAILLDYWLIGWLVNHHLVRPRMESSRAFQLAQRWFMKAPFLLVVGSALAPVPFYPVKIIAIASDYSLARFIVALVIGRFPRFWLLAIGGREVQASNSSLLWIAVALAALGAWRIWNARKRRMLTLPDEEEGGEGLQPPAPSP